MYTKTIRIAAVAAVLVVAACSSNAAKGGGSDPSGSSTSTANSSQVNAALAVAKIRVTAYSTPPTSLAQIGITKTVPVPSTPPRISYDVCQAAACQVIAQSLNAATTSLGGKLLQFSDDGTAQSAQAAMQNIVNAKVSAAVTAGNPLEWYQSQLDSLHASNTPVINYASSAPFQSNSFYVNLLTGDDYYLWGVLMADYAAVQSNGQCGTVIVQDVPAYPVLDEETQGAVGELAKVCPGSKVVTEKFSVDDLGNGNNVTTTIADARKNPDLRWIISTLGATLSPALASGLKSAGATQVKALATSGTSANLQLIKSGNLQVADLDFSPQFLGYRIVDEALRAIAGQPVVPANRIAQANLPGHPDAGKSGVPYWFVTAKDISNPNDPPPPPFADYASAFAKLWQR